MDKNSFLIFNDLIYRLYNCGSTDALAEEFLSPLKMLLPYSYASIFLASDHYSPDTDSYDKLLIPKPICLPESFRDAELRYLDHMGEDQTLWTVLTRESCVVRDSNLFPDDSQRQHLPIYLHCYRNYQVYDILQFSIVYHQKFLGILSLFRTRADGTFTRDDVCLLRDIGIHVNAVIHRLCEQDSANRSPADDLSALAKQFGLTVQETRILELTYRFLSQEEIAEMLDIRPNTLQKHMQNIFRKMNAASRWELLKYRP